MMKTRYLEWKICFGLQGLALLVALGVCGGGTAYAQFLGTDFVTGNASGAVASGVRSTAIGQDSEASGLQSTALGENSTASGTRSTALGRGSTASGDNSTGIGEASTASGVASTALGEGSTASGIASTAIGQNSTAGFANSTAIGFASSTTRDNQMVFGTATETYTTPGITSAASTAAQTGPVEIVTSDATGNLATTDLASLGLASTGDLGALRSDINSNTQGVAMAMALSGIPVTLPRGTDVAISTNWGTFNGENAVSIGGSVRLTRNIFANGGTAFTSGNSSNQGGRAGVTIAW